MRHKGAERISPEGAGTGFPMFKHGGLCKYAWTLYHKFMHMPTHIMLIK